jgi:hypothetical protein
MSINNNNEKNNKKTQQVNAFVLRNRSHACRCVMCGIHEKFLLINDKKNVVSQLQVFLMIFFSRKKCFLLHIDKHLVVVRTIRLCCFISLSLTFL